MTILIVDDNDENLYMLQVLLKGYGFEVEMAINGEDALNKARQNPPIMIISDILMPKMDGFALCRHWKKDERLKNIPFIVYTATYTDKKDEEFALSLGAERFIIKPAEPEAFINIIKDVLDHAPHSFTREGSVIEAAEEEYLRQHNETLFRKLNQKINDLQASNRSLEQEISERKETEKKLLQSLKENKTLIQELYHRTYNNMQLINSLLALDSDKYRSKEVEELVASTENRIQAMSLVHHMLYQSNDLSVLNISEYIKTLVSTLVSEYRNIHQKITLDLDIQEYSGLIDTAVPLGLVLNELIAKSTKVSLKETKEAVITIRLKKQEEHQLELLFSDNGCGIEDIEESNPTESLGLNLIRNIIEDQMDGQMAFCQGNGFSVGICFSDTLYTKRV